MTDVRGRRRDNPDEMTNTTGGMAFGAASGEPVKAPRSLRVLVADDDQDTVVTLRMLL